MALLYSSVTYSPHATRAHLLALQNALAAELRRRTPYVELHQLDQTLRARSLAPEVDDAYRITSWISEIEFAGEGTLAVSCRVAAKVARADDPEGRKAMGYARLYGADRAETSRRCVETAGRNLASYHLAPTLELLVLFERRFQPESETPPAPEADAAAPERS
jgi:hypothetical protein